MEELSLSEKTACKVKNVKKKSKKKQKMIPIPPTHSALIAWLWMQVPTLVTESRTCLIEFDIRHSPFSLLLSPLLPTDSLPQLFA